MYTPLLGPLVVLATTTNEQLLGMTREPDGLDIFLISDREEEELESQYETWGPIETVVGLVISAGCLGGILFLL